MGESVVPVFTNGLLSKWGFSDGDCLNDFLYDLKDAEGVATDHHKTLIQVVHEYVLPALDQQVEVFEINTIHNPIRARTVDGKEVNHYENNPFSLTPAIVEVPAEDIKRIARSVAQSGRSDG